MIVQKLIFFTLIAVITTNSYNVFAQGERKGKKDSSNEDSSTLVITVPSNITAEATSSSGATVNYTASAVNSSGSSVTVKCSPNSGSTFPVGSTVVECTAGRKRNRSRENFLVNVVDTTPPDLTVPQNITAEATSSLGASINFNVTTTDTVDSSSAVACNPASGTTFKLGQTTVSCTAWDSQENRTTSTFDVGVIDSIPPQLILPADITVETTNTSGLAVTYSVTANDAVDPETSVSCTPGSGSLFNTGTSTVICSASDKQGNSATGEFLVSVVESTDNGGNDISVSVTLSWTIPSQREDGSALAVTSLSGYEIYVIQESTANDNVVAINDPLSTTYTLDGLTADIYHFSMVAVDTDGEKSKISEVVSVEVK